MSFKVILTSRFEKEARRITRSHPGFKNDIESLTELLEESPIQGSHLGHGIYKVRLSISGKATGKSYGARSIHAVFSVEKEVYLLTIYDKSDKKDLSKQEVKELVRFVKALRLI